MTGAETSGQAQRRLSWIAFGLLLLASLVATLLLFPYVLDLIGDAARGVPLPVLVGAQVAQTLVLVAAAIGIGLWLGPRVGLGAPLLLRLIARDPAARGELRASVVPSVVAGVAASLVILALEAFVFQPLIANPSLASSAAPAPWKGLLASFYGGIVEELLLRFGLMTFLVWLGAKVTRAREPGPAVMWIANVLAALLFGAGHLPATSLILPLTSIVVARAFVLNGLAGIVFGWLYWRRGILAAMLSHFSSDIVLHVLTPLIGRCAGTYFYVQTVSTLLYMCGSLPTRSLLLHAVERGAANTGAGPMITPAFVRNGIALVAGSVVAWSLAAYGPTALTTPAVGVAAMVVAVIGLEWLG